MTEKTRPGTPGFWVNCGPIGAGYLIRSITGAQIAVVYGESVTPEAQENVDLIAALPETLVKLAMYEHALHSIANGKAHPAAVAASCLSATSRL